MSVLRSRENPRVKRWTRLVADTRLRGKEGRCLIEGPHLVGALLEHGLKPLAMLASESALERKEIANLIRRAGLNPVVLSESVFRSIVDAETPPGIAAEIAIPEVKAASAHTVFLEGIQDSSNVGAIVRSAAAFGVGIVVLDAKCADPWSPKALRAGMGGHFLLAIREVRSLAEEVERFRGKLVCAVAHGGDDLRQAKLSDPIGWIFGSEGAGVSEPLQEKSALRVTIPMAPGSESLNVAAAAAICLYHSFSRPGAGS